ncbi:hypothetical protein O181_033897 [Austropuccinia psidii MF-1]|uniref:RNase H type-1 domain-containing protein n=1 Tax=Austropuccinia psidii MF-1 TaxID=1389203 RepID=A0A9Q3D285_9BASI|nr:hypothetical protein [Austropuccinia psidii MF-1]
MMDSNLHHPHSPPRKRHHQGMWEERLLPCFTKTHPNILRSGRQTHNNRPHLGESHHPKETHPPKKHLSIRLKNLDNKLFLETLQLSLAQSTTNTEHIEATSQNLSTAITTAYNNQGKWVTTNPARAKAWWDKDQLNSLVELRNKAIVETVENLDNIPQWQEPIPFGFPQVTEDKVANAIAALPNKKAPRPDGIPNKLIKLSKPLLTPILPTLYNLCFKQGRYPEIWKESQTEIIRKAAKDNDTNPNAYRPIALLDTLGKLFEKIINNRLMHWEYETHSIHPGHMGGRPGSPLSVTLYLIYNSNLLLPNLPSLNANNISIAYINDMTHLIAADNTQQAQNKAEEIMARSKKWGSRYEAIFDEKKTNFMLFTRKRQPINKITIERSVHKLQKEIKWLGITLTPTLSPGPHFQAALKSITLPKKKMLGQQLIIRIFNKFQQWSQDFMIKLYWCPGHTGIQQNEEVDKLAKEAATSETRSQHTLHHISISKLKQTTNQASRTPPKLTDMELARVKFKTPPKLIIQALDQLEKGPASMIHQLRSDHSPLNAYLY